MANLILRPDWHIPESRVTPESVYWNRRHFLRQMGLGTLAAGLWPGAGRLGAEVAAPAHAGLYPARRNVAYDPGWKLTREEVAASYNNFYEFSLDKDRVRFLTDKFVTHPWQVEITGLVEKPVRVDVSELHKEIPLEERVYRFRCVEAWAMIVPWTGFSLAKLLARVNPKPEAKYVRFETFHRPEQAPGFNRLPQYPWPYFEGLRLDEAMHPLTFVATGIYGKPMPKQHGAPLRLVVPWKYGYKSIKSIVKIEFVEKQPATFWETLAPDEYPFESNVNPAVPHPRWSQAFERMIDTNDRVRTQPFNGYGPQVASLYSK
jgi:methionine sulfoxide reductase catalytic subunit